MTKESFTKWVHNFGMGSSAILLILMSSFPIVISMVYGVWPDFKMIIPGIITLTLILAPWWPAEYFGYMTTMGPEALYMSYTTGNVTNLRMPATVGTMNALENVELPLIYRGIGKSERRRLAKEALVKVGLEKRMTHRPAEMSGGQQQRVAIARAIAAEPPVILADEPTGNLDSASTQEIMEILKGLHGAGRSVILITHDNEIAEQAKRVVRILDGRIVEDYWNEERTGGDNEK